MPTAGDYAELDITGRPANAVLHTREIAPLQKPRPTAHLPFAGNGVPIFVAVHHTRELPEADGRYLWCHGTQVGFHIDWTEPGMRAPDALDDFRALCLVGDAWPVERAEELRSWVTQGGGLLLTAPFGALAAALDAWLPLRPLPVRPDQPDHATRTGAGMPRYAEAGWAIDDSGHIHRKLHTQTIERIDPVVGLQLGAPQCTAEHLMLEPDAKVRIGYWEACRAHAQAIVPLRFTDTKDHPAVCLRETGLGRVAAVASRPAWGANYRKVVWDGWGQYHRAFWAGLMGWLTRRW